MLKKKIISLLLAVAISATAFLIPLNNVQALTVSQQYINQNRSYQSLQPQGLVIHDTDNAGATAQNNRDYFNRVYASASAHYFVDWNNVIQTIPESEVAWHAGYTANHRYLSLEMCEPANHNIAQFNAMYQKTVELASDICKRHGWNSSNIVSHYWVSMTFRETDHEDPIAFLQEYGKSWNMLLSDIQKAINGQSISTIVTSPSISIVNNTKSDYSKYASFIGNRCGELQSLLNKAGYNLTIDGNFGANTLNAVMSFQKKNGLQVDGLAGNQTFKALYKIINNNTSNNTSNNDNWVAKVQSQIGAIPDNQVGSETISKVSTLRYGSQGELVKLLQQRLKQYGFYNGNIDGIYGSQTARSVKAYQVNRGLEPKDLICGKITWRQLML